jgi:hypothetical protein
MSTGNEEPTPSPQQGEPVCGADAAHARGPRRVLRMSSGEDAGAFAGQFAKTIRGRGETTLTRAAIRLTIASTRFRRRPLGMLVNGGARLEKRGNSVVLVRKWHNLAHRNVKPNVGPCTWPRKDVMSTKDRWLLMIPTAVGFGICFVYVSSTVGTSFIGWLVGVSILCLMTVRLERALKGGANQFP